MKVPIDSIVKVPIDSIKPAPQNEAIYQPVSVEDPAIRDLAASIGKHGLQQPLVLTSDYYVISGHRRLAACGRLEMPLVPCRFANISADDPQFMRMLVENNIQRVKSFNEAMREQVVLADPDDAYQSLIEHRQAASRISGDFLELIGEKKRSLISRLKMGLVQAITTIVLAQKPFWPLADRSIHYDLLNDPPLRNLNTRVRYKNDRKSYQDLTGILTRMRLEGRIAFDCIADPTRTVCSWSLDREAGSFAKRQLEGFMTGYWRDLMQSQPNHIEIIGEKNTIQGSIRGIAMKYCIPYTIGRGYASLDPRHQMAKRFKASGKEKLRLLVMSDFDPEGEDIPNSFALSMRDDFGIKPVELKKVCLTYDQVKERGLKHDFKPDEKDSSRKAKFQAKYGKKQPYFELEALSNEVRASLLQEEIDKVIDVGAFNRELDAEKADSARIAGIRTAAISQIATCLDSHL